MERSVVKIDLDSAKPFAEQIKDQITQLVRTRQCQPGKRLPTVRQLALDLEINANELSRICRQLEDDGYLLRRSGIGTYAIDLKEGAGSAQQREAVYDV